MTVSFDMEWGRQGIDVLGLSWNRGSSASAVDLRIGSKVVHEVPVLFRPLLRDAEVVLQAGNDDLPSTLEQRRAEALDKPPLDEGAEVPASGMGPVEEIESVDGVPGLLDVGLRPLLVLDRHWTGTHQCLAPVSQHWVPGVT